MNTVMTKRASSVALLGLLSLGAGTLAAQSVRPLPAPNPPSPVPMPPPLPPSPPSWARPFSFDFKFNPDDFNLDLDLDAAFSAPPTVFADQGRVGVVIGG